MIWTREFPFWSLVQASACTLTLTTIFVIAWSSSPFRLQAEDDITKVLRAGAAVVDITPTKFPVSSAGSMSPRTADSAYDRLHARCLVLDNSDTKIALVTCDSCMIPCEIFDRAKQIATKQTGIAVDHVLASATHTHTAVTVTPAFQSHVQKDYIDELVQGIAAAIVRAHARLEPARVGWAVGHNPRQVFNRRWFLRPGTAIDDPFDRGTDRVKMNPATNHPTLLSPAGPVDPEVPVLAVQAIGGRPLALWANYALHYVGGVPPNALSADYFGEFASQFSKLVHADQQKAPFVAAITNGTSGDINNVNFFEGSPRQQPFEQIRLVASDVAQSAHVAYQRVKYHDWVPIKMREAEIELDVRKPTAEELERANKLVADAGPGPLVGLRNIYAGETIDLAKYPDTVRVKLQAIRIGDLGIVSSPCETFVETGLAIKRDSPLRPTFTIELANGYNGYLPTPDQHALGGYETWRAKSSYLAIDAEPKIRNQLLDLLHQVSR